jgi:hypothetical protein
MHVKKVYIWLSMLMSQIDFTISLIEQVNLRYYLAMGKNKVCLFASPASAHF